MTKTAFLVVGRLAQLCCVLMEREQRSQNEERIKGLPQEEQVCDG